MFQRLRSLHVALVGCGRTGSLVVDALAALGVARLTLIDPDMLELHNLGEMVGRLDDAVGRPKAEALAALAVAARRGTIAVPVVASVRTLRTLFVVKPADLIVSCPDSAAALRGRGPGRALSQAAPRHRHQRADWRTPGGRRAADLARPLPALSGRAAGRAVPCWRRLSDRTRRLAAVAEHRRHRAGAYTFGTVRDRPPGRPGLAPARRRCWRPAPAELPNSPSAAGCRLCAWPVAATPGSKKWLPPWSRPDRAARICLIPGLRFRHEFTRRRLA